MYWIHRILLVQWTAFCVLKAIKIDEKCPSGKFTKKVRNLDDWNSIGYIPTKTSAAVSFVVDQRTHLTVICVHLASLQSQIPYKNVIEIRHRIKILWNLGWQSKDRETSRYLSKYFTLIVFWYVFTGCWGVRHTFVILAFLGCANMYAMRVNLSVAIVAMVDNTLSGKSTLIHNSYFSIFYIRKDLETNIFQAIQKMKLNLDISVRFLSSSKIQKTNQ